MRTTANDWVISGHGLTSTASQPPQTQVPAHIRFIMLAPPGASLAMALGQALERGQDIARLTLRQHGRDNPHQPQVYAPGSMAPNLTLQFIAPHDIGTPTVPHVIGVSQDTQLQLLWQRIPDTGKVVDVYWAACADIDDDPHGPMVDIG